MRTFPAKKLIASCAALRSAGNLGISLHPHPNRHLPHPRRHRRMRAVDSFAAPPDWRIRGDRGCAARRRFRTFRLAHYQYQAHRSACGT